MTLFSVNDVRFGVYVQYDNGSRALKKADLAFETDAEDWIYTVKSLQEKQHKLDFFIFSYTRGNLTNELKKLRITR